MEFSLTLITVWLDLDKEIRRRGSPTTINTSLLQYKYCCTFVRTTTVLLLFIVLRFVFDLLLRFPSINQLNCYSEYATFYYIRSPSHHSFCRKCLRSPPPLRTTHYSYSTPAPVQFERSSASDRWFGALLSLFVFKLDVCEARGSVCLWLWSDMCSTGLCATQDDNEKHRKQPKVQEVDFGILPGKEATLYKQCK